MTEVLLDARILDRGHTGIARYVRELAKRLVAQAPAPLSLTALLTHETASLEGASDVVRARAPFLSPLEQLELPLRVAAWRARRRGQGGRRLFWVPAYDAACLAPGPLAITMHDVNHLAFSQHFGPQHAVYFRTVVKLACERARVILVPSAFARNEAVQRLRLSPERMRVTPYGVSVPTRPEPAAIAKVLKKHGIPPRYVLYVGNFKAHKNPGTLLAQAPRWSKELPLVLLGGTEGELGAALTSARAAGARVHVVKQVPDAELWPLVAGATVFAFPSRYEGFGLPPLEAMALGVPVVSSNAASLPEVVGNAAITIDPDDADGFAEAIARVAGDAELAKTLVSKGLARAAELTWERCAEQTAAALLEAARLP